MGQLVGGLGPDGAGGGVEADRLVDAGLFLQRLPEHVVDPDVPRVPLLGLAQYRLSQRGVIGFDQAGAEQVQADRAQGVVFGFLFQGLQSDQPGRLVGFVQGVAQIEPPRIGIGDLCGLAQARRAGGFFALAAAGRRPVIEGAGECHCHGRWPGFDPCTRLGRRQVGQVDPGRAKSLGVISIADHAIRVVGLGRADVDQAIEQGLVAPGGIEPGLDFLAQSEQPSAARAHPARLRPA